MKRFGLKHVVSTALSLLMVYGIVNAPVNAYSYIPPEQRKIADSVPEDYTGLGYWLDDYYHTPVQYVGTSNLNHGNNNNTKLALGDFEARIIQDENGIYKLRVSTCYETDMNVWSMTPGQTSDLAHVNPYTTVINAPSWVTGTTASNNLVQVHYRDLESGEDYSYVMPAESALNTYTGYDSSSKWHTGMGNRGSLTGYNPNSMVSDASGELHPVSSMGSSFSMGYAGGYTFAYWGHDGIVRLKVKVNNGPEIPVEFNVPLPANYYVNTNSYFGRVQRDIPIDPAYGEVKGVQITEVIGNRTNIYCRGTDDGVIKNDIVKSVGFTDIKSVGNTTQYTIQLDADAYLTGVYDISFRVYLNNNTSMVIPVRQHISSSFGCDPFILNIPVSSDKIKSIAINGITSISGDGVFSGYSDRIYRPVSDWRFDVVYNASNATVGVNDIHFDETISYNVRTRGEYEFTFAYVTYENNMPVTTYVSRTYNFNKSSGTYRPSASEALLVPKDVAEVRLANVKSPDGYIKYYKNNVFYTNNRVRPELPTRFTASINVPEVRKNQLGTNLSVEINYAAPADATYTFVYECKVRGESGYRYVFDNVYVRAGYGRYSRGCNGSTINPLIFPSDVEYIKLYRVEKDAYHTPIDCGISNYLLYCGHKYDDDFDANCNICGELRDVPEVEDIPETSELCNHVYACNAAACSICGEIRDVIVGHQYDNDCSDRTCNVEGCGYVRPYRELSSHNFGSDTSCRNANATCINNNCGAARPYVAIWEHNWGAPCSEECQDCDAIRHFNGPAPHEYGSDGNCIYCGEAAPTGPRVLDVTHYWNGYDEGNNDDPIYYADPLNNGEWGARIVLDSRMPSFIDAYHVTYTVEYEGQVIYTGNGPVASLDINKIPSGFEPGRYIISFYEANGDFIYSDLFTIVS